MTHEKVSWWRYYKVASTGMYTLIKVNNFIIFRRALSSISVLVFYVLTNMYFFIILTVMCYYT